MSDKSLKSDKKEELCDIKMMPKIEAFYQKTDRNTILPFGTEQKK